MVAIFLTQNVSRISRKAELKNMQEVFLKIFTDLLFITASEVLTGYPLGAYTHAGHSRGDSNVSF